MKNNEIKLADLQAWKKYKSVVYASSTKEKKQLECTLNGTFVVYHNGGVVWQGTQPFNAVEEYNKIGSSAQLLESNSTSPDTDQWRDCIISELTTGDIVIGGMGVSYLVTNNYGDRATAVNTVDITNAREWKVLNKGI